MFLDRRLAKTKGKQTFAWTQVWPRKNLTTC